MVNPLPVSVPQTGAPVHDIPTPPQAAGPKRYTGPVLFLRWCQAILEEVKAGHLSTAAGHLAGVLAAHYRTKAETEAETKERAVRGRPLRERECAVGERTLRKLTGRQSVKRYRDELEAAGWLKVEPGDIDTTTIFRLAVPPHIDLTKLAHNSHTRARSALTPVRGESTRTLAQRARSALITNGLTNGTDVAGAGRTRCVNLNEEEEARRRRNLRKAVGEERAHLALLEVDARLEHGEPVLSRWTLARVLGDCYAGRCRNRTHSDLHGAEAIAYHASRRRDWEQEQRAAAARQRGPTATIPDDDPIEEARRRQVEALTHFDTGSSGEVTVEGFEAEGGG